MSNDKLLTCLWFDFGEARNFANFVASTFPDSHIGTATKAPNDFPCGGKADMELTIEFTVLGRPFLGLNGGPEFKPNEAVSFQVLTDSQEETDKYWDAIVGNGGKEVECGWCTDKWGFAWQITPRALTDAMKDPDVEAAKRAMKKMFGMKKINIKEIEEARKGGDDEAHETTFQPS